MTHTLDCDICKNLLLDPYTTPCGHTCCAHCICRNKHICPVCRKNIYQKKSIKNFVLGTIINEIESFMNEEQRLIRKAQKEHADAIFERKINAIKKVLDKKREIQPLPSLCSDRWTFVAKKFYIYNGALGTVSKARTYYFSHFGLDHASIKKMTEEQITWCLINLDLPVLNTDDLNRITLINFL